MRTKLFNVSFVSKSFITQQTGLHHFSSKYLCAFFPELIIRNPKSGTRISIFLLIWLLWILLKHTSTEITIFFRLHFKYFPIVTSLRYTFDQTMPQKCFYSNESSSNIIYTKQPPSIWLLIRSWWINYWRYWDRRNFS